VEWFENEELSMIIDTISTFSVQEISDKVVDLEGVGKPEFPRVAIDTLSDLGFLWGPAPEDLGSDMNSITSAVILSELAGASAGFASIVASHYAAVDSILAAPDGFEVLKGICDGNGTRGGGYPLLGISLERAVELNDGSSEDNCYLAIPTPDELDSTILFWGKGPDAKMVLTESPDISRYIVMKSNLSGCDEMPTVELSLPDTLLESLKVIASGNDALRARNALISSLKLYYSAVMQGAARSATVDALNYAEERHQTGRAIIFHQNVRKNLIEMEIANQSMASFLYRAACNDADDGASNLKDMLFAFMKVQSEHVVNEAIQTLGGYGYMKEYGLEKKLRDIKTLQALLPTCLADWLGLRYE